MSNQKLYGVSSRFKKNSLGVAVLMVLGSSVSAQGPGAGVIEEVVVSGIRHSLETASDLKRNSPVIVDAITAEDVGKFPDANVADSLQRITGVQISRDRGGEGRFVSIRGLSSQFNMTRLNGRTLATDNAGRDFSFDVMPSEAISGAEIYKTSMASLAEGSIGGLINLTTAKPLDRPGFQASGSLGALYDGKTEDWNEQISGVVSNTFRDDTIGASLGVSYYNRSWRADTYDSLSASTEALPGGAGERGVFPGIISYQTKFGERERLGFTGALQFRPNESIETTIDAFYSKFKSPENAYSFNVNFYSNDGWARFDNVVHEPWSNSPDDQTVHLITSFDLTNIPVEIGNDTKFRETETWMVGWNTLWTASDRLNLTFDVAYSEADRPVNGREFFTVAGVNGGNFSYTATPRIPGITCTLNDGRNCLDITNDEIGLHFMEPKGENVNDEVLSVRFDGDLDLDFELMGAATNLQFGLTWSSQVKDKAIFKPDGPCGYCGFGDTLGEVGVEAVIPFPRGGYQPGADVGFNAWPALDPLALFHAAALHRGSAYFEDNISPVLQPRASSKIDETVGGAYLQANFAADRWSGNIGGRWVTTDVISSGHSQELLALTPIPGSTNFDAVFSDVVPVQAENSYSNFLPSLSVNYDLRDDLKTRFSTSRTITRPTISQMGPDVNWEVNSLPARVSRNGNPNLEPIESDNVDLSLEWYGQAGSSAAAAVFYKEIDGFITGAVFPETMVINGVAQEFEVSAPVNGDTAEIYGIELAFQHVFDSGWGFQSNYTWVDSRADVTINDVQVRTSLDGVSQHTWNLVGFYEAGDLSARLAWTYRDEFTACSVCGPASTSTTTKSFGSLDFSGSYEINKNLSVYLEAQNLLEDDMHTWFGDRRATQYYEAYSRRVEVGLRAKF